MRDQSSSGSIVSGLRDERSGFNSRQRQKNNSSFSPRRPGSVAAHSLLSENTGGYFPVDKAAGCEAYHSLPSITEVNTWNYSSTTPYVFMASYLIKHRDNFALQIVTQGFGRNQCCWQQEKDSSASITVIKHVSLHTLLCFKLFINWK
jgi:hypothetical protein